MRMSPYRVITMPCRKCAVRRRTCFSMETRKPGKGMGPGTYIIQEIIMEHGDCIAVSTLPARCMRITIRLPRKERQA